MQKSLIKISLSEIIPYEKNNKKHGKNVDEIVKSIQANTYITPIIVDEDNIILAGHGRKLALDKLQVTEAEVLQVTGLSETQKRDFRIRDNKLTELSEWDRDNLKFELDDLNIPDLTDLFKDEEEMEEEAPEAEEDDFEVDDQVKTDIVLGDLFEIGEHRLLCGDSTDSDQVAKLMNSEKADMVFTDPPYNINVNSITFNTKIENDNLNEKDFKDFIQSVISNVFLFCKGSKYICFDIREKSFINIFYENGMKSLIVWVKDIGQHHRENYGVKYELIAYFEDGAFYGENEENVWECKSIQSAGSKDDSGNLWFNGGSKGLTLHPTQKPILIPTRAINNSSKTNELVLDLFLGSGSTMVAAHQLKRKCYGMELDPKYCQVIINRMYKLDPTLTFKKNGQPYNPETNDYLLDK